MNMQVYLEYGMVTVRLSRRNILTLLHQVEHPVEGREHTLSRQVENGWTLIVIPEADEEHYLDRRPGYMSAAIEAEIAAYEGTHDGGAPTDPMEDPGATQPHLAPEESGDA